MLTKKKLEKCKTSVYVDVHGGIQVAITQCKVQHARTHTHMRARTQTLLQLRGYEMITL
jgi:hypothetical protein